MHLAVESNPNDALVCKAFPLKLVHPIKQLLVGAADAAVLARATFRIPLTGSFAEVDRGIDVVAVPLQHFHGDSSHSSGPVDPGSAYKTQMWLLLMFCGKAEI